jgi:hypothetical protein
MEGIGVILIAVLLMALYAFLGWAFFMLTCEYDSKLGFDADDYSAAIIILWPLMLIAFIVIAVIQLVNLIRLIIYNITKK